MQAPRDSGVVATNVGAPAVALVTDAAGGKLKVIAFSRGGDEEFWLGEELRVGGSSKGKRITVNWLKCDHGVYVREIEDKVKESRVLLRNVLLEPDGNGWTLSRDNREKIQRLLISKVDDTSSDDDTLCVLCGEEEADDWDEGVICDGCEGSFHIQ